MKELVKVTQEMVDYVESHRGGPMYYPKDFKIEVGEVFYITGLSRKERRLQLDNQDGIGFSIPAHITGISFEEIEKEWDEECLQQELEDKRKERLLNTDWESIRSQAAIVAMSHLTEREGYDNGTYWSPELVAREAVKYADALVKELQKS